MRRTRRDQKTNFQLAAVMALTSGLALLLTVVGAGTATAAPLGASPAAIPAATAATGSDYFPVTPVRICDTRAPSTGVTANQCDSHGAAPLAAGGVVNVTVTGGTAMVPADASAVVLHVTATDTTGVSYFTVWPAGQSQPVASSLNWAPNQNISNTIQAAVGANGQVSVYNNQGSVDLVVDLEGYYEAATGGLLNTLPPVRVCDTRLNSTAVPVPNNQCNTNGTKAGTMQPMSTMSVNVGTGFNVPATATAVVVNVTVTNTSTDGGFLTVWPHGVTKPLASDINWAAGQSVADRVITPITMGVFDVFNDVGTADVVIDLDGYFASGMGATGAQYFPVSPERICDTRAQGAGIAGNACNNGGPGTLGPVGTGSDALDLPGQGSVAGLALNVTVTNTTGTGFLTVFPDNESQPPNASDLNWTPGTTIANLDVTGVGSGMGGMDGIGIFNGSTGNVDVVIDLVGFYEAPAAASAQAAAAAAAAQGLIP